MKIITLNLSENSLSTIIKNDEIFKKNNKFSRTEYEKFLIKNSLNAIVFENNMSKQVKKETIIRILLVVESYPPDFLVNDTFTIE